MNLLKPGSRLPIIVLIRNVREMSGFTRPVREIRKEQLIWFPGHISKGINQMSQKLVQADLVIEIHDARIPFTGRTDLLRTFSEVKPRILVFNKVDLIPSTETSTIRDAILSSSGERPLEIYFSQLNDPGKQSAVLQRISETISEYFRTSSETRIDRLVMVGGLPNVGKSSFINSLRTWYRHHVGFSRERSRRPSAVGQRAGVTRAVSERILLADGPPRIYVLDSPGVWHPPHEDIESVLKLGLCGCLDTDQIDMELVIDYMLYWLNRHGRHDYVNKYQMPAVTDSVLELLQRVCIKHGLVRTAKSGSRAYPMVVEAVRVVYRDFAAGALGKFVLDDAPNVTPQFGSSGETHADRAVLGTIFRAPSPRQTTFPFVWAKSKIS